MPTDWNLIYFQAAQAVVTAAGLAVLGCFLNWRIERLKVHLARQQILRAERKEIYFEVLEVLSDMRTAVDRVHISLNLGNHGDTKAALEQLDELRAKVRRLGPSLFVVLGERAKRAFEKYQVIADKALRLDPNQTERWHTEASALDIAVAELVGAARRDLEL